MTSVEPRSPADEAPLEAELLPATRWDRFEALLGRLSDRLNPILVKEARQALRSKQFAGTFFVMLIAGWAWSILGLAWIGPGVAYASAGPTMFWGYQIILAFPLIVVAPYAAYFSLAGERQDRTYELVSITSLTARQILTGKLCSIALQMIVYLSAIFPCLAFTYLLRGLDIFTILLCVVYTCAMSFGAAVIGLLLAALAPPRQRQIAQAVVFAIALFGLFWANVMIIYGFLESSGSLIDSGEFWQVNLALLTFYVAIFSLVFLAARAQLTTVNQNRSTALRVALLATQLCLFTWLADMQLRFGGDAISALIVFSVLLWSFAGVFITGESSVLSPRVKRDLPQSVLGRIFLSWFAPGPGTGYMFIILNLLALVLATQLPYQEISQELRRWGSAEITSTFRLAPPAPTAASVIAVSYVIIYLGLGKLILAAIARYGELRLTVRVLAHVLLVLAGTATPVAIQMSSPMLRRSGWTLLQTTNPLWTIWESCTKGVPLNAQPLLWILPMVALMVWAANLPSIARELQQVRVAKPPRVAEEDAELAAQLAAPAGPSNPWDEGELAPAVSRE